MFNWLKSFVVFILIMSAVNMPLSAERIRAALDLGSGQTKMAIAVVDEETGYPLQILFGEERALLLGHDLKHSSTGHLSAHIIAELEHILIDYQQIALQFGVEEFAGAATAVFRESKNGANVISDIQSNLGINLRLITQEQEGNIGFLSAVAASNKKSHEVIAWDSGGASFQITAKNGSDLEVYKGQWGASKVVAAMIEQVQGLEFNQTQTPNLVTIEDVKALQTIIQKSLAPLPKILQEKLNDSNVDIVAIGGPFSAFKMAVIATGSEMFTKAQVWEAINGLVGIPYEELSRFPEPEMLLPRLTLIYAVMDQFGFEAVHYHETIGSTPGIFITPEFWE